MSMRISNYSVYASGIYWGDFAADTAEDAIQAAAEEHGTVDVGQDCASVDGMTAKLAA